MGQVQGPCLNSFHSCGLLVGRLFFQRDVFILTPWVSTHLPFSSALGKLERTSLGLGMLVRGARPGHLSPFTSLHWGTVGAWRLVHRLWLKSWLLSFTICVTWTSHITSSKLVFNLPTGIPYSVIARIKNNNNSWQLLSAPYVPGIF